MKKTIIATVGSIMVAGFIAAIIPGINVFAAGNITLDQAKQIALDNAGVKASDVTFVKEGMEIDDGMTQYEIEFYKGTTEYDYEIDAATGKIISFDQEIETKYMTTAPKAATETVKAAVASTGITKDQALQIALDNAGFKKSDVNFPSVNKDFDDGMEIYEVEFRVGLTEYNYDIAVSNGQIVDYDIDD